MNYIISGIIALVIALGGGFVTQQYTHKSTLGAFSDPFLSVQVGSSPSSGYYLKTDGTNSTWAAVAGGGGGSGGGTWATTTSTVSGQLINSSLNDTDIICIGNSATTTCEYWFDPNTSTSFLKGKVGIGTTSPYTTLSVVGASGVVADHYTATGTVTSQLPYASSTAITATNGYFTKFGNLTSNGFVKVSGSDGTASVDTNTYLTGVTADSPLSGAGTSGSHLTISTSGTWSGNAVTATALAANGTNCSAGNYPLGVDASGNSESCTAASTGTVTAVSVASANGFAGSSSGGATPALTLSTTITANVLKGNGTAISGAVNGTDYTLLTAISCTNQFTRAITAAGVGTCATVANTDLANSTISGVALGSNLNALTVGASLTGTSYNGSAAVSDWNINVANANIWTALQTFKSASSTSFSSLDGLFVGRTATTTIRGDLGTSTFSSFISAVSASTTATSTMAGIDNRYGSFLSAGLASCNSASNALTWINGVFGCNTISGSGTVNSGGIGQLAYYNAAGTAVQGTSTQIAYFGSYIATSTIATSTFNGPVAHNATTTFNANVGFTIASTSAAATQVVNWQLGTTQRFMLTGSTAFVINATSSTPIDGGKYILKICQDPTGSRAVTFTDPGSLRWSQGTTSVSQTANTCTWIGMIYDSLYQKYSILASTTVSIN